MSLLLHSISNHPQNSSNQFESLSISFYQHEKELGNAQLFILVLLFKKLIMKYLIHNVAKSWSCLTCTVIGCST